MKEIRYKGKGEHNVHQLEAIIEQREERIHQLCIDDNGLLAKIRNKMSPVSHYLALVQEYTTGSSINDEMFQYVKDSLPEALKNAEKSIEWLRDNNNF